MNDRLIGVGEDFTLPANLKFTDANLPERLTVSGLSAAIEDSVAPLSESVVRASRSGQETLPYLITFITDDGRKGEIDMAQPFISHGVPLCGCIITDFASDPDKADYHMNWVEIKDFVDNHGFEYGSHTVSVGSNLLDGYSDEQIEYQLAESKRVLEEKLGKPVSYFVLPQGADNLTIRNISRKHYRASFDTLFGENRPPLVMHTLGRTSGQGTDDAGRRKIVDDFLAGGPGWLVIMLHSEQPRGGDYSYLDTMLSYIASKNIPVVTVTEGLDYYENKLDVGDFMKEPRVDKTWDRKIGEHHTSISPQGELFSEKLDFYSRKNSHGQADINATPNAFPRNTETTESVNGATASAQNWPTKQAGRVITLTFDQAIYDTQLFLPIVGGGNIYRRTSSSGEGTGWYPFEIVGTSIMGDDSITAASPLSAFAIGKITASHYNSAESSTAGFLSPTGTALGAGTAYTHRTRLGANKDGWSFQDYHVYRSGQVWRRFFDTGLNAWLPFQTLGMPHSTKRGTSLDFGIVAAGTTKELTVSLPMKNSAFIIAKPASALPAGITVTALAHQTDLAIIRLANITDAPVTVGIKGWDVAVFDLP